MRGLEKRYMKRGQQRNKQTNIHTLQLLDQLGPGQRAELVKIYIAVHWSVVYYSVGSMIFNITFLLPASTMRKKTSSLISL